MPRIQEKEERGSAKAEAIKKMSGFDGRDVAVKGQRGGYRG